MNDPPLSQILIKIVGIARVFGSSPLGADLSRAVASMEKETPGIFGKTGASGQVFSLYTSASAAGVLAGPAWTSFAFGEMSWIFLVSSLGILTATVAIPVVSNSRATYIRLKKVDTKGRC